MAAPVTVPDAGQEPEPLFPEPNPDDLSSYLHRQLIGYVGLGLPWLLWLYAGWLPTQGVPLSEPLGSVSAYFYTSAVPAFVGGLVALAVFLFTYHGYNNPSHRSDRQAAVVAGIAAVLVAFFPTDAPHASLVPLWWKPVMSTIHYLAAVVLFGSFIFFCLVLFRKTDVKAGERPLLEKQARNSLYLLCGIAMLVCMAWAAINLRQGASIFWPEALALQFFAISWLVKGRADWTARVLSKRAIQWAGRRKTAARGAGERRVS